MKSGMSSHHAHAVARHCEHTQNKIHTVAELLLLSSQFRPIRTENTSAVEMCLGSAQEQINSSLTIILEIVADLARLVADLNARWKVVCDMLYRLGDAVTVLVELVYFVMYEKLEPVVDLSTALIDKYCTSYAGLEIKLSCVQLKRARLDELNATFIMDICSNISKYISVLTEQCRGASEAGPDTGTRDQFKLAIKSVTCAAGGLIASIKAYKNDRSPRHHTRVVTFCEPVLAASCALVSLATEEEFVGEGRELTPEEKDVQKAVFGPCMNLVSGCVQLCKSLRDFTYDTGNSHYTHKVRSCHSCVLKSSNHLKHELQKRFKMDFQVKGLSPLKGENFIKNGDSSDSPRELIPFGRRSPIPSRVEDDGKDGGEGPHDQSPSSTLAPSDITTTTLTASDITTSSVVSR
ncbi:talin rod domain-containing protein 1-like [Mya arenaria]|nr:talin rod domain-containing protein 1-like [Mya arenaria]